MKSWQRTQSSFVHSFKTCLSRYLYARYGQIMDFSHVKSRTQIRGCVSTDSRREWVWFWVFWGLCNQEFEHVLKYSMKVIKKSRWRANSSSFIVFPLPRGFFHNWKHDSLREWDRFCACRTLCKRQFEHVLQSLVEVTEDSRRRENSSAQGGKR